MPKSPDQAPEISPEEIAKIEKNRTISDAELLIGGAKYEIDTKGDRLLVLESDQVEKIKKEDLERRTHEIAGEFISLSPKPQDNYAEQIVRWGETPEAYIFSGRQIVRNSLELITKKLLETGEVSLETGSENRDKVKHTAGLFRLRTGNPMYKRFVDGLNGMNEKYPLFFEGSFEVLSKREYSGQE
jgi:hypothetical protein